MKKLLRHLLALVLAAALSGVFFLLLVDSLLMPALVKVDSVRVPRLLGQDPGEARRRLDAAGLRLALDDSLYHENIPLGAIVAQDPEEGMRIKRGRRIAVHISKGPRFYLVPDVRQVSLREARLQLEASQLQVGELRYTSSESIPQGVVAEQIPPPGTALSRGARVDLSLSSGPSSLPKRVPELIGLPIEVVEDTLRKYEMRLGDMANRVDNDRVPGTVLSQSPEPRSLARRGTPIDLVLSVQAMPDTADAARNADGGIRP